MEEGGGRRWESARWREEREAGREAGEDRKRVEEREREEKAGGEKSEAEGLRTVPKVRRV